MLYRYFYILFLLSFSHCLLAGQIQKVFPVTLQTKLSSLPSSGLLIVRDLLLYSIIDKSKSQALSKFKNLPRDITEGIIKYIDFQPEEQLYENYLFPKTEYTENNYTPELSPTNLHDTSILDIKQIKHNLFFLIGTKVNGKRVIIVDANNNQDFGDDIILELDSALDKGKRPWTQASVEIFYKKKFYKKNIFLFLVPFANYKGYSTEIENKLSVSIFAKEYKYGTAILGKDTLSVVLTYPTSYLIDPPETWQIRFDYLGNHDDEQFQVRYSLNDTIQVRDKFYHISLLSPFSDSLLLTEVHKQNKLGIEKGMIAYPVIGKDIITNKKINSNEHIGEYGLIDFWGSWCKPCLNSIPELIKLHKKYGSKLYIISVAVDEKENLQKLKNIISKNNMKWNHIIEPFDRTHTIHQQYRINKFPSYILIGPDGKIIKRFEDGSIKDIEKDIIL